MRRDTAAMAAQDLPEANRQFRKFGLPPPKNRNADWPSPHAGLLNLIVLPTCF
jgi:hypothetical protein